mgnify:CR=1 FL=1
MKLPLKPGRSTTEFWAVIIGGLLTTGIAAVSMLDVAWAALAIAAMTIGYNYSRHQQKMVATRTEADLAIIEAETRLSAEVALDPDAPVPFVPRPPSPTPVRPVAPHTDPARDG